MRVRLYSDGAAIPFCVRVRAAHELQIKKLMARRRLCRADAMRLIVEAGLEALAVPARAAA